MYQYKGLEDTIAAISTPVGQGGIGIVRLSGKDALVLVDKMFAAKSKRKLIDAKSHTVHYGWIMTVTSDQGPVTNNKKLVTGQRSLATVVDEVLVTVMRGPKSFTAEDVVEISCHGGSAAVKAVLECALQSGARLAEPGEFTKRAFLNGRIDLTQAEAVLDIIQARTQTFLRVSTQQLKGELSAELESIRENLMPIYMELEALVNFPEDEIDEQAKGQIAARIENESRHVKKLLDSSSHGRLLKEGIRVVLCGKPNVGKSSLLNVLLKTPRAIVTDIAGTTRDVLEESAQIQGIPFQLVDTAGILEPRDLIEEEAIKRSHLYIQSADLVLLVLDGGSALEDEDMFLMEKIKHRNTIVVVNKSDRPPRIDIKTIQNKLPGKQIVKVSALKKSAVDELENIIVQQATRGQEMDAHGILVSNLRHIQALNEAHQNLMKAAVNIGEGLSLEFISEELKIAVNALDSITGRNIDADLLDKIFSAFCIGK